jgi:putative transposase
VLTLRGLVTYYVLFFIHLESRRVDIAGITIHPDEPWMQPIAPNATMEGFGTLRDYRYLLHDRDTQYTQSFRAIIVSGRFLRLALSEYVEHDYAACNHQGKDNVLLFSRDTSVRRTGHVQCRKRLGGFLRYYHQEAA